MMKARKIFLTYASEDKNQVLDLALDLREAGLSVWLDEWEIFVGDSITQKIQADPDEAQFLAIWLTRYSVKSKWVQKELGKNGTGKKLSHNHNIQIRRD